MNPREAEQYKKVKEMIESGEEELILDGINLLVESNLVEAAELMIPCLESKNEKIRMGVIRALGDLNTVSTLGVLSAHQKKEQSPYVRATAAVSLGMTKNIKALIILASLLRDENSRVRANAVEAVAEIGDPLAVAMLTPLLEDTNNRVKANVAMALWKFGGLRMVSHLKKMLTTYEDKWHRASAAYALGEIGGFQAMSTLLSALDDRSTEVKRNVIRSLGKTGDVELSHRLIKFLEDNDPNIRAYTIEAVGLLDGERYVDVLIARLADEVDPFVLEKATMVIEHLVSTGSCGTIQKLRNLLFSGKQPVKLALVKAFEENGSEEVIFDLHNVIRHDISGEVKDAARKAIKTIREREDGPQKNNDV